MSPCMQSVLERPALPVLVKYLGAGQCRHGETGNRCGRTAVTVLETGVRWIL